MPTTAPANNSTTAAARIDDSTRQTLASRKHALEQQLAELEKQLQAVREEGRTTNHRLAHFGQEWRRVPPFEDWLLAEGRSTALPGGGGAPADSLQAETFLAAVGFTAAWPTVQARAAQLRADHAQGRGFIREVERAWETYHDVIGEAAEDLLDDGRFQGEVFSWIGDDISALLRRLADQEREDLDAVESWGFEACMQLQELVKAAQQRLIPWSLALEQAYSQHSAAARAANQELAKLRRRLETRAGHGIWDDLQCLRAARSRVEGQLVWIDAVLDQGFDARQPVPEDTLAGMDAIKDADALIADHTRQRSEARQRSDAALKQAREVGARLELLTSRSYREYLEQQRKAGHYGLLAKDRLATRVGVDDFEQDLAAHAAQLSAEQRAELQLEVSVRLLDQLLRPQLDAGLNQALNSDAPLTEVFERLDAALEHERQRRHKEPAAQRSVVDRLSLGLLDDLCQISLRARTLLSDCQAAVRRDFEAACRPDNEERASLRLEKQHFEAQASVQADEASAHDSMIEQIKIERDRLVASLRKTGEQIARSDGDNQTIMARVAEEQSALQKRAHQCEDIKRHIGRYDTFYGPMKPDALRRDLQARKARLDASRKQMIDAIAKACSEKAAKTLGLNKRIPCRYGDAALGRAMMYQHGIEKKYGPASSSSVRLKPAHASWLKEQRGAVEQAFFDLHDQALLQRSYSVGLPRSASRCSQRNCEVEQAVLGMHGRVRSLQKFLASEKPAEEDHLAVSLAFAGEQGPGLLDAYFELAAQTQPLHDVLGISLGRAQRIRLVRKVIRVRYLLGLHAAYQRLSEALKERVAEGARLSWTYGSDPFASGSGQRLIYVSLPPPGFPFGQKKLFPHDFLAELGDPLARAELLMWRAVLLTLDPGTDVECLVDKESVAKLRKNLLQADLGKILADAELRERFDRTLVYAYGGLLKSRFSDDVAQLMHGWGALLDVLVPEAERAVARSRFEAYLEFLDVGAELLANSLDPEQRARLFGSAEPGSFPKNFPIVSLLKALGGPTKQGVSVFSELAKLLAPLKNLDWLGCEFFRKLKGGTIGQAMPEIKQGVSSAIKNLQQSMENIQQGLSAPPGKVDAAFGIVSIGLGLYSLSQVAERHAGRDTFYVVGQATSEMCAILAAIEDVAVPLGRMVLSRLGRELSDEALRAGSWAGFRSTLKAIGVLGDALGVVLAVIDFGNSHSQGYALQNTLDAVSLGAAMVGLVGSTMSLLAFAGVTASSGIGVPLAIGAALVAIGVMIYAWCNQEELEKEQLMWNWYESLGHLEIYSEETHSAELAAYRDISQRRVDRRSAGPWATALYSRTVSLRWFRSEKLLLRFRECDGIGADFGNDDDVPYKGQKSFEIEVDPAKFPCDAGARGRTVAVRHVGGYPAYEIQFDVDALAKSLEGFIELDGNNCELYLEVTKPFDKDFKQPWKSKWKKVQLQARKSGGCPAMVLFQSKTEGRPEGRWGMDDGYRGD